MIDLVTRQWMRNRSDELAVANACWFDVARAAWTVWWIEKYCRLYEGEWAGENMLIRSGCPEVDAQVLDEWSDGGEQKSIERAETYAEWIAAGNRGDWQYECFMRLFGWVRHSTRWNRTVRRFRRASIWIPKKQKKSPSLAAAGVYLICGDGEQGAKCFGGAKDGNQAGIAMDHAIAMIEQSPELSSECKINKNERSILHLPTRSKYKPLSSANERSKNSKEGINGHILIDETHVVDRDFMSIICRAGISRAEPLQIEVSTAGNNPDGYGKEQQDQARKVVDGLDQDDNLFVAIYEAPQDLTDTDLDLDPVKYGVMANPAWGHTAHEEEYLADYKQSKRSLSTLADFKMYRLNIWQQTSSPWVRMDDWDKCAGKLQDWSDADAVGAGVDLGARDDLAVWALAARFPIDVDDDGGIVYRYEIKCQAYITDESERVSKPPFDRWIEAGLLKSTRYPIRDLVTDLIEECHENHAYAVAYDPYNAQQMAEDLGAKGIKAASMAQKCMNFNGPIRDFVQSLADGHIAHEGNPLLRWCATNAVIRKDKNNHWQFDKGSSNEKIDAVVATVMAFRMCQAAPARATGSLYL